MTAAPNHKGPPQATKHAWRINDAGFESAFRVSVVSDSNQNLAPALTM